MTSMHDDDGSLGALLDDWRADRPHDRFASTVVRAAELERARLRAASTPRGVVVPLLLAALFVSLGAAAAFSQRSESSVGAVEETLSDPPLRAIRAPQVAFHATGESAQAEPEPTREASRNQSVRPPSFAAPTEIAEEETPVVSPHTVHFPRCECGTSGVVCACTD
jgi:hypothetical protein